MRGCMIIMTIFALYSKRLQGGHIGGYKAPLYGLLDGLLGV